MNAGSLVGGDCHKNQIIIQKKCILLTSEISKHANVMKLCLYFGTVNKLSALNGGDVFLAFFYI